MKVKIILIFTLITSVVYAQSHDDFEDGTTQGWTSGVNQQIASNITTGGPAGTGDNYLQIDPDGGGPGGKLVVFNQTQWTGDFTSGGITDISFHVNNLSGSSNIDLRVSLMVSGGTVNLDNFWASSTSAISISGSPGWQVVSFPVDAASLTALGLTSITDILSNVGQTRILDATAGPSRIGDVSTASLGIDNISVGDTPLPVELSSFRALVGDGFVELKWITESEINNLGFIILRSDEQKGEFIELDSYESNDNLVGAGNTSQRNEYIYIDNNVFNDHTYWYKLVDIAWDGLTTEHKIISATPTSSEVALENSEYPSSYRLYQNYPNPFNPSTIIRFDIPNTDRGMIRTKLEIYDILGKKIITLFNDALSSGNYSLKWYGQDNFGNEAPAGLYIYTLKADFFTQSRKILLVK